MKETRTVSSTGGQKGVKKQAYHLIPARPLHELAVLYGAGEMKYPARNFMLGYEYSKSFASFQRHLSLFWSGETDDLELGTNHLTNVAWHCITLYCFYNLHPQLDDRPHKTSTGERHSNPKPVVVDTPYPEKHVDLEKERRGENSIEPRYDLIPQAPIAALAELLGSGRARFEPEGRLLSTDYARLMEHAWAFWGGEDTDEQGVNHMVWCLFYTFSMLDTFYRRPDLDNRFTEEHGAQPLGFDSQPEK